MRFIVVLAVSMGLAMPLSLTFSVSANADTVVQCNSIRKADDRHYCKATRSRISQHCSFISDANLRAKCYRDV